MTNLTACVLTAAMILVGMTLAFPVQRRSVLNNKRFTRRHGTLLESDSDFDGFFIGDAGPSQEGRELSLAFSQELKQREEQRAQQEKESSASNQRILSEDELRAMNQSPFGKRRQVVGGQVVVRGGNRSSSSSSAGFFTSGQSVYSFPLDAGRMMPATGSSQEQEGDFAPAYNNTLLLPILVAIALVSLYLVVGLVGGGGGGDMPESPGTELEDFFETIAPVQMDGSEVERFTPSVYL